jgi:hypothetical protein
VNEKGTLWPERVDARVGDVVVWSAYQRAASSVAWIWIGRPRTA